MAVTLTGTGGLFTRLGKMLQAIRSANQYLGNADIGPTPDAIGTSYTDLMAQFVSALQNLPEDSGLRSAVDAVRDALNSWKATQQTFATNDVVSQVNADNPLVALNFTTAYTELQRQMIGSGTIWNADNDVDASTVSASVATVTGITNHGLGTAVVSVQRPADARPNELVLAETMELLCDGDQNSGATARSESFAVSGEVAVDDPLAWNWPGGSGASTSLTVADTDDDGGANALFNGNFDAFTTTNQPDYFGAAIGGAYGTEIKEEASIIYRAGGKCLNLVGTGTAAHIAQAFGVTVPQVNVSGTSFVLKPNTAYAIYCQARKSAGVAAGKVDLRLCNSSHAQLTDAAGNNLLVQIDEANLSAVAWTAVTGSWITPSTLVPTSAVEFNIKVSTLITGGESIYIDDLTVCEMTEAYPGGPLLAIFPGSLDWLIGDRLNVVVANDYAGDFQTYFERVFGMRALGFQLPSNTAGAETIADTLIG